MDPLEALRKARHAIEARDYSDAVQALNDYYQWRVKGGFEPIAPWVPSHQDARGDAVADGLMYQLEEALS